MMPATAAAAAPTRIASVKRTPTLGIASSIQMENRELENAPTHMKPACPRLSSPSMPTVRFKEIAIIV